MDIHQIIASINIVIMNEACLNHFPQLPMQSSPTSPSYLTLLKKLTCHYLKVSFRYNNLIETLNIWLSNLSIYAYLPIIINYQ